MKKFRRILFVIDDGSSSYSMRYWLRIMSDYAEDVTLVSLGNSTAADLLELPADCMVIDGRARDLTGIGFLAATAQQRGLRTLAFYAEHWQADDIAAIDSMFQTELKVWNASTYKGILRAFLEDVTPTDYEEIMRKRPWEMRPLTASLEQIRVAMQAGESVYPPALFSHQIN